MTSRAEFVAAARDWIGVDWRHQGRTRAGVDCVGLLLCLCWQFGLSAFDYRQYTFSNDPDVLFDLCDEHMTRIPLEEAGPADVVAMSYPNVPHHMAILGDYQHGGLSLIHAVNLWTRKVVEHRFDDNWRRRVKAAYRVRGLA